MWLACNKGITQFYLPPTHEPYLPLLPSRKASPTFGWYSLLLPTKGWPGWVDLGGWSHTEIMCPAPGIEPDTVTHLSTNRARRWLTSLIEANALTITPDHQPTTTAKTSRSAVADKPRCRMGEHWPKYKWKRNCAPKVSVGGRPTKKTRNSSGDEIANVNFLYDDLVHVLQNTIDSCINSATDRRGYVLKRMCLPNLVK